ncbi:hypothetical protein [Chitinivibrio alkaliphilus]|uniref:ATP-grasp domain-containing protein n=1 Tax=Chitinivibrio alkaliphilus ACht1 TaxID=1313304 RepID=U7D8R7_9BACT|nr:hypothetical protein [Chitinivibrio alkaliphilus]ERP31971.1 hypothetical protein CALK_1193 [Chitinivibrio alkaliphilus ACht1]
MILFYFNGAADRTHRRVPKKIARAVDQGAALFCAALPQSTGIYSGFTVDESYYSYLGDQGLAPARLTMRTEGYQHGDAWSMNGSGRRFLTQHTLSYAAPPVECVHWCNSRVFAHEVQRRHRLGVPGSRPISSLEEFRTAWRSAPSCVLKPNHGNAGGHFFTLTAHTPAVSVEGPLEAALARGECFFFEPWKNIVCDIATKLSISSVGAVEIHGHHRNWCNRNGAFYANSISADDTTIAAWKPPLDDMARSVGGELFAAGYFGPVGIDSFLYEEGGSLRAAFAIDINARHTISTISYGIREKRAGARAVLYRFIAKRRHRLPDTYTALQSCLRAGFAPWEMPLLTTPLRMYSPDGGWVQPARSAFYLEGESQDELLEKDERLRRCILK